MAFRVSTYLYSVGRESERGSQRTHMAKPLGKGRYHVRSSHVDGFGKIDNLAVAGDESADQPVNMGVASQIEVRNVCVDGRDVAVEVLCLAARRNHVGNVCRGHEEEPWKILATLIEPPLRALCAHL